MCRNWICNLLCRKPSSIPKPYYLDDISVSEVYTILKAEFPNCQIYLSDSKYKTTSVIELRRFLSHDMVDKEQYVSQYFDCDDFSFSLLGNITNSEWGSLPFGLLWTEIEGGVAHAVNIFIDDNRIVHVIEPQDDSVFSVPGNWKPYLIVM